MKNQGVIYILTATPHAARLVVSLVTLRRHYHGPVTIYATLDGSRDLAARIAADERLAPIEIRNFDQAEYRRNSTYMTKVALFNSELPYETTLYLDADTIVTDDLTEMFDKAEANGICLTQFSNWMATQNLIQKRIWQWEPLPQFTYPPAEYRAMVAASVRDHIAAINVGILSIHKGAAVLPAWLKLAAVGWNRFIPDEISLQILYTKFPHAIVTDRFNYSPLYGYSKNPAIWHFHGDKHLIDARHNPKGDDGGLWGREFTDAAGRNYGRVAEWFASCGDGALNTWQGIQA